MNASQLAARFFTLEIAVRPASMHCGRNSRPSIRSRRSSTPISMPSIQMLFHQLDTAPSPSSPAEPIMWSASTARYGSRPRGWCVQRYSSRRSSPITRESSSISSVTTTSPSVQHYQNSTTPFSTSTTNLYPILRSKNRQLARELTESLRMSSLSFHQIYRPLDELLTSEWPQ